MIQNRQAAVAALVRIAESRAQRPVTSAQIWDVLVMVRAGPPSRRALGDVLYAISTVPRKHRRPLINCYRLPDGRVLYSTQEGPNAAAYARIEAALASGREAKVVSECHELQALVRDDSPTRPIADCILRARTAHLSSLVSMLDVEMDATVGLVLRPDEERDRRQLASDARAMTGLAQCLGVTPSMPDALMSIGLGPREDPQWQSQVLLDVTEAYDQIASFCGFCLDSPRSLVSRFPGVRTIGMTPVGAAVPCTSGKTDRSNNGGDRYRRPRVFFDRIDFASQVFSRYGRPGALLPVMARRARAALGMLRDPAPFIACLRGHGPWIQQLHAVAALGMLDDPDSRAALAQYLHDVARPSRSPGQLSSGAITAAAVLALAPLPAGGRAEALGPAESEALVRAAGSDDAYVCTLARAVLAAWTPNAPRARLLAL